MAEISNTSAMGRVIEQLSKLPGIGKRSAQRIAFYLLKASPDETRELAEAITDLTQKLRICTRCGNASESDPCPICSDTRRDHGTVLVVEQPLEIVAIETTGQYRGVYHVLMGRLAPLEGVGPGELNIQGLVHRVRDQRDPAISEVIIGTNPTLEGDGTALYLAQQLSRLGVKVTRLARGMPTGATLETVSKAVLTDAILSRQNL